MAELVADDWRKAELNEKSGTLFCLSSGDTCKVASLARTTKPTNLQPAELADVTARINGILDLVRDAERNGRCLRFLRTPYGPFLAWTVCDQTAAEGEPDERLALDQDPDAFCESLRIAQTSSTQNHWVAKPDGKYYCLSGGSTQYAPKLASAAELTQAHDAQLARATSDINAVLTECESRYDSSGLDLCFLTVPTGFLLALTEHRHTDEGLPLGGVTATSPTAEIIKRLSLAVPRARPKNLIRLAGGALVLILMLGLSIVTVSLVSGDTSAPQQPTSPEPAASSSSPSPSASGEPTATPATSPSSVPGPPLPVGSPSARSSSPSASIAVPVHSALAPSGQPSSASAGTPTATPTPSSTPKASPSPSPYGTAPPTPTRGPSPAR